MKQLIKQIFKSLKSSILLILSLIFLSFCIIAVSSSSLFANLNINNSIDTLRSKGNSSNIIIEKKYNSSDIKYTHTEVKQNTELFVSNYEYLELDPNIPDPNHFRNVIFPYQSTDFTNPSINDKIPVPTPKPDYFDEYQKRYEVRKYGMARGGSGFKKDISNSINSWKAVGFSMTDHSNGEKLFDPKYFIFEEDKISKLPRITGYFNDGSITNDINMSESLMVPTVNSFTYQTNQGIAKFQPSLIHRNVLWHYRLDLNPFLNDYGYYSGDFLDSIVANTRKITIPYTVDYPNVYTIKLDTQSLSGVDLFVYNAMNQLTILYPTLFSDYKKTINQEFTIREEWINDYHLNSYFPNVPPPITKEDRDKIVSLFLDNRKKQLANEFKLFVVNNRDLFIQKFLENSKYQIDNNSSFSFYDRESKKNYLISKKEDNFINKIVLNDGQQLSNSAEYRKWYTSIYGNLLSKNSFDDKALATNGIKSLVEFFGAAIPSWSVDTELSKELKTLGNAIVNKLFNDSTDVELKWMLKKFFSYYSEPNFFIENNKNIRVNVNFQGNSTVISNRGQTTLPILDNYRITTSKKFIDSTNKEILPLESADPNNLENWKYAKKLSLVDFNNWLSTLDSKYVLQIGIEKFIITGAGLSPEMAFPIVGLDSPIPNPDDDILIYANESTYKQIWKDANKPFQHEYFSVLHSNENLFELDSFIRELNNKVKPIMNNSQFNVVKKLDDVMLSPDILSIRYSFPTILSNTFFVASIIFVVILSLLAIYLFFIVLKRYINTNKVQLAIIKANGLSTFKMSICFSIIALVIAIVSALIGYVASYFLQPIIFSIFAPYIFIPPSFNSFNFFSLFGSIIVIFAIATLFVFIILNNLFKKPLNLIMSENIEIKQNKFLKILKYQTLKMSSNNKFKFALFMSNTPRTLFYIFGCLSGISLITISLTLTNKFYTSKYLTDINKDYIFNIDLVTPTDQSGLHKTQEYSKMGLTNPSIGITSLYDNPYQAGNLPYTTNELKVYEITQLDDQDNIVTKVQKRDSNGQLVYFGNIALPSVEIYNLIQTDPDSMRNAVIVKWLLDFTIPILNINVWDQIRAFLPIEIISKIDTKDKEFKEKMIATPGIGKLFTTQFTKYDAQTKEYFLDGKKIIIGTKLNPAFLEFIGLVYGNKNLSNSDAKISWSIIPIDTTYNEAYTYVDANIYTKKGNGATTKIYGINPYSNHINLKNNSEQFIGNKLDSNDNNIIINNGAALKYNLKIGDTIKIKVNNSYFRYTSKMMGLDNFIPTEFSFNVVDINSTSFGEEFFISQKKANEITYLDKGEFVSRIEPNPTAPSTLPGDFLTITKPYINLPEDANYYVPYNGFFCNTNDPIYLSKTLSFYSLVNLYGKIGKMSLNDGDTSYLISTVPPNFIAEAFLTKSDFIMKQYQMHINPKVDRFKFKEEFIKVFNNYELLINYMNNYFGEDVMILSLSNIANYNSSQIIYTTLINTLDIVQTIIMSLLIPIVILIIFIMSSIMLNEIKGMISIMKTLGYSDKQNIVNILFTFLPIFIISVLLSLAVLAIFLLVFQNIIYQFLAIYISASIHFLQFLYAILAIFAILIVNILFTVYTYKHTKLNVAIVS